MQTKKLFKYIPITIMTAGVVLAVFVTPTTQVFNDNQQVNDADYTDQLDYIRSDVAKLDGVTTIKSIELANGFFSKTTAAIVTKTDDSTLLYTWGDNSRGQLGLDSNTTNKSTPEQVTFFSSLPPITQIALGEVHSAALLNDGSLYTWGDNSRGQLGLDFSGSAPQPAPTLVDSKWFNSPITQIALGMYHSAALLENGSLYTWGRNDYGQLGLKDTNDRSTPIEVTALSGLTITQIAIGSLHSAARLEDGSLYTWGYNSGGQLGLTDTTNRSTPEQVTSFGSSLIKEIVLGGRCSAALLNDGTLYTWGNNSNGQLGLKDTNDRSTPEQVTFFSSLPPITEIALGSLHSAALLKDGSLYTWGWNQYGQLGLDNKISEPTPTLVDSKWFNSPITQIALGLYHSTALLENGSLYTWGYNTNGQLGLGNSGLGTHRSIPTRMPYLGKDSHITAKDTITAKQAVDSFWVDGALNQVGFNSSFNLINILDVADQEITMDTKPTYNNRAGTVTMKIKFKYFYDENGLVVADTPTTDMTISGFKLPTITTNITALSKYPDSVVVDKWKQAVTVDNKLNYNELKKYLDLNTVPITAEFEITNDNSVFKTGVLTFDITTSKVFDSDNDIVDIDSPPFPITLKLTPRITKMSAEASTSNLTAAELKAKLFNEDESVKDLSELEKYMSVVAPVDNVKYYLIPDSWNFHPADGTLAFTIYADKYYDGEGNEQSGSATNVGSQRSFNLSLQREASSIAKKSNMPDVRVDQFETYVKNSSSVVRSKLEEFLILTNVPSDATFAITDVKPDEYDANFERNQLKFKLTIDKFNKDTPVTVQPYSEEFKLTLGTQHAPTSMSAKDEYDANISVMQFFRAFTDASYNVTNRNFLEQYINIQSLPAGAKLTIESHDVLPELGQVKFSIKSDQAYNEGSDLFSDFASPLFTLDLVVKKQAPVITVNDNIVDPIKAEEFVQKVKNLSGEKALTSYLFDQYLKITGDVPPETVYFVKQAVADHSTGAVGLEIYPSKYYDDNDDIQTGTSTTNVTKLTLQLKGSPSRIEIKAGYPTELRIDQFVKTLQPNGTSVSRSYLEKYFNLTNIPNTAVFSITNDKLPAYINGIRNTLSFDLNTTIYNDADGVSGVNTQTFSLVLAEQHEPTSMQVKPGYDNKFPVNKFFPVLVGADDSVTDRLFLTKFVELRSVPNDATLTVEDKSSDETTGKVSFKLITSSAYDNDSNPINYFEELIELTLGEKPQATIIKANPDITSPERVDRFAAEINRLTSADLKNYLFPKYLTLTGDLPADAVFSVTDIITTESTGKITFNLWATSAYNSNGDIKNDYCVKLSLNLGIKYLTTNVIANTSIKNPDRVDVVNTQLENLTDDALLTYLVPRYLTITGDVPTDATIKATDISITELTGAISFNLVLSSAYDVNCDVINGKDFAINLMVGIKHLPTSLVEKTYDNTQRVDQVAKKLNQTGPALKTYLEQFMVFNSVPEETIITVENIEPQETTGKINFDVVLNQYYDANSDLILAPFPKHFDLILGIKHAPTTINLKTAYKQDVRIDEFIGNINGLEGQSLHDYLAQDYLDIDSLVDVNMIKASVMESNYDNGTLKLKVEVPSYYDADSELIDKSKPFSFDLILIPKYTPTTISVASTYKKDLTPTKLIQQIDPQASITADTAYNLSDANISFLSKFLNFTSIPMKTSYTLTLNSALSSDKTGQLSFKLSLNQHYNVDGDLVLSGYSQDLTLNIATINKIPSKTAFTRKSDAPIVDSEAQFKKMVHHSENIINEGELAKFVEGLDTLPSTAKVQRVILQSTDQGILVVGIEVSSYYDGEKADAIVGPKTFSFDVILKDQVGPTKSAGFEWWWIVIAIGGATIIGLIIWLLIKRNRQLKR